MRSVPMVAQHSHFISCIENTRESNVSIMIWSTFYSTFILYCYQTTVVFVEMLLPILSELKLWTSFDVSWCCCSVLFFFFFFTLSIFGWCKRQNNTTFLHSQHQHTHISTYNYQCKLANGTWIFIHSFTTHTYLFLECQIQIAHRRIFK